MTLPDSRTSIISMITNRRAEWDAVIEQLTEAQCLQPDVCGWWSVKDVIAHLSWYEQQMTQMTANHSMDTAGGDWWLLPMDERNDRIYQLYQGLSLAAVKTMAQESYAAMLAAMQQLEDADVTDPARFQGMPVDWIPAEIIAQNTWEHYADHLTDIRAAFGG